MTAASSRILNPTSLSSPSSSWRLAVHCTASLSQPPPSLSSQLQALLASHRQQQLHLSPLYSTCSAISNRHDSTDTQDNGDRKEAGINSAVFEGRRIDPAALWSQDPAAPSTVVQHLQKQIPKIRRITTTGKSFFFEVVNPAGTLT